MFNLIEKELKNKSITENGAIGYKSSGSALVDLNYNVSSFRNSSEEEIIEAFDTAFAENKKYAMKWLFFARDVREGLGERRLFRICYKRLAELDIEAFYSNLKNISEYGRWDDLVSLLGISNVTDDKIIEVIKTQLDEDLKNYEENKPISLLAKWLPSENASSLETKALGKQVRKSLGLSPRNYRLLLSKLRKYSNVVETKMCANHWHNIDYEQVPSLANLKYKDAFLRHDENRRVEYLDEVKQGSKKTNMSVATPVDAITKYRKSMHSCSLKGYDETLELAWKNLKNIFIEETLVVADGSGSMTIPISGKTTALDVANGLAIYTSEHNSGVYKDKYITFSNTPQFVDLSTGKSLRDKIIISYKHSEIANTNIEAVFDLILEIAVANNVPKEEMIKNILMISDMEFDAAQRGWRNNKVLTTSLFISIRDRYVDAGYDLPKLIFWNVNSRTKTIPLTENRLGVTLVSGFSQNVLKMVMSNKYDPYAVLIEMLDNPRYDSIVY